MLAFGSIGVTAAANAAVSVLMDSRAQAALLSYKVCNDAAKLQPRYQDSQIWAV